MKITYLSLFLCISLALNAQLSSDHRAMSQGMEEAVILDIESDDQRFIEKCWKEYAKTLRAKPKKDRKSGEWACGRVDLPGAEQGIELFLRIEKGGAGTETLLWGKTGDGFVQAARHPGLFTAMEDMLLDFDLFIRKEKIRLDLDAEEKQLKNLEKELGRLQKDKSRYETEIERAEERIVRAKENIVKNLKDQELKEEEIERQKEKVRQVMDRLDGEE